MPRKKQSNFWTTLPGVLTAIATLITAVGGVIAIIINIPKTATVINPPPPPPTSLPVGIEITATISPQKAVDIAFKAKSIAPTGAPIRIYKRRTASGSIVWAPVVLYTDNTVANIELSKYKVNDWDPELVPVNEPSWQCLNPREINSPIGTDIKFPGTDIKIPVLDCT
jgi:hypothetical protein